MSSDVCKTGISNEFSTGSILPPCFALIDLDFDLAHSTHLDNSIVLMEGKEELIAIEQILQRLMIFLIWKGWLNIFLHLIKYKFFNLITNQNVLFIEYYFNIIQIKS